MPAKPYVYDGNGTWLGVGVSNIATINPRDSLVYGSYKPDATTTGPLPGVTLTQWGDSSSTTDFVVGTDRAPTQLSGALGNNQIVENLEIWGRVSLKNYSNVTVKNCIIHGTLERGINTAHVFASNDNQRGALIIDSKLCGRPVTVPTTYTPPGGSTPYTMLHPGDVNDANEWCNGLRGGAYTIRRCELTNMSDGLNFTNNVGGVLAEGCWIHDGWYNEWDDSEGSGSSDTQAQSKFYPYAAGTSGKYTHADCVQFSLGKNYTIRGNNFGGVRVPGDHNITPSDKDAINSGTDFYNSCIILKQETGAQTDATKLIEYVLIEKNWFMGAECCFNFPSDTYSSNTFSSVTFQDNKFTRSTWGQQYYVLTPLTGGVPTQGTWSNNTFEDDGTPVTLTNGS